ncbi:MAG: GDSL-type esterase/lipase family protein [Eubacteriales bacterium]|nr:GDSL-type esterase/lipase family protein [Eubacteriales bacterium]
MQKSKMKDVIFSLVLLIVVGLFFLSFFKQDKPTEFSNNEIKGNICMINEFNYSKVEAVEKQIAKLEKNESHSAFSGNQNLTNAQYRKIFSNSVIIGDSITEGLTAFNFLGNDVVLSKIGAALLSSQDLFDQAADLKPRFAFFSLGMNDTGYFSGKADAFASKYQSMLIEFRKKSPDTQIYINSILPPSDDAIKGNPNYGRYKRYNEALKEMCKSMEIGYIDNTNFLTSNPEFYAGDGIHVSPKYYTLWLNNMIIKAGL